MLAVIERHRRALRELSRRSAPPGVLRAAELAWDEALERGAASGYRNAQTTLLPPTGTVSLMLD
jgi:ribonucleoside-diphosphate reductase alpha chain